MPMTEDRRRGGRGRVAVAPVSEEVVDISPDALILAADAAEHPAKAPSNPRSVWPAYIILGIFLFAYMVSLFARRADQGPHSPTGPNGPPYLGLQLAVMDDW
jgi:hypothetical protein